MPATLLLALCLLSQVGLPDSTRPADSPPTTLTRPQRGRLVTSGHEWQALDEAGAHRLCLTVKNRDHRTAYEVVAWVELLGGVEARMRRLALHRTRIEPSTLAPGEEGAACVETPIHARGIFIRLRARWPVDAAQARSGALSRPGAIYRSGTPSRPGAPPRSGASSRSGAALAAPAGERQRPGE